jgi:hypothetical protein
MLVVISPVGETVGSLKLNSQFWKKGRLLLPKISLTVPYWRDINPPNMITVNLNLQSPRARRFIYPPNWEGWFFVLV